MPEEFSWTNRRVFVTGGNGFIGRWLCQRLVAEGARVTALIRPRAARSPSALGPPVEGVETIVGGVEDTAIIERVVSHTQPDTVFHLAANNDNLSKHGSPLPIFETNIRGTWSLLEGCRVTPGVERIVCASSSEVGSTQSSLSSTEGVRPRRHPYPVSKLSAELVALAFADTYEMPIAIGRSENVYGGGDFNWNRLIPGAVRSILRREVPTLRSNGLLLRDYIYVEDIVDAYLTLAARAADPDIKGQTFHFSSGTRASALEITSYLCDLAELPHAVSPRDTTSENERINEKVSGARERQVLGWSPRTDLRAGLRSTVEWYRHHLEYLQDQA